MEHLRSSHAGALAAAQFQVRFDLPEMQRVAHWFGDELARSIVADRAALAIAKLPGATLDLVTPNAIHLRFAAPSTALAEQHLGAALCAIREPLTVAGAAFVCRIEAALSITGQNPLAMREQAGDAPSRPDSEPDTMFARRLGLLKGLFEGLPGGAVDLEYQPKADMRDDGISSVEALLRWRLADGSFANTGELIALAEVSGDIRDITLWTLTRAVRDLAALQAAGHMTTIFVNVSADLLSDADIRDRIIAAAHETGCRLGIEVTETAALHDPAVAIANLQAIAAANVPVAIDDFGSGLSSLEYLQQLPACEVKIDRNFIAGLSKSNRNPLIVRATIDLAHAMEMKVTAEGVEDGMSLLTGAAPAHVTLDWVLTQEWPLCREGQRRLIGMFG